MKILHIIPNLVKGGAQRIAIDICRELSKREGIEVKLVYFSGNNEFEYLTTDLDVQKVNVNYHFSILGKKSFEIHELQQLCDEFQPEVIHSHLFLAEFVSRNLVLPHTKFFTHCHDNIRQFEKFSSKMLSSKSAFAMYVERKYLLKKYAERNNHFIAIAKDGLNYLNENLPAKFQQHVHLLHNAIDLKEFQSTALIEEQTASALRLINVGNFIPKKNQVFLVRLVKALLKKNVEVHLSLVGDGEELKSCKQLAKDLQVEHLIQFLGRRDDVSVLMAQHDVYVHSAIYEPFGLVLIEAMASALPVVSLDGKGNRDIIVEGKNGFLIKQNDLPQFAEKIRSLHQDRSLLKKMGNFALDYSKQFGIESYVDKLLELYKST